MERTVRITVSLLSLIHISLETVEMVMELEEELDVELELDEKVATIAELNAFVEKKVG